ncbi:MAG: MBL fold metallo-hydrolase [Euryarchaeota archaeon]|nr:MBL fold metallo-hydrolase [Euryarchaeota archaeon]
MKSLEMGRSYEMRDFAVRLIESGHMLGASQLVVENGFKLVYTGDLHLEGGATCSPARVERCDVLIIESTFGSPHYEFPPREEVIAELKDWIEEKHSREAVPVVLGYSLGKAQELTRYLSSHFCVEVHPTIYENNRRYEALGVALGEYRLFSEESREDRVVIFPPAARRARALEKLNPSFAFMSGWAVHEGTRFRLGVEEALPLSDHSDFYSLLRYVEKASPQVVYTVHGFAEEFAEELRARGFYAEALVEKKLRTLEEYL